MSIDSDLQAKASITEGDRALDLFTDRYRFTRLMAKRINELPSEKILFFHGAGGNGKSLLLKYLQQNICKRLTAAQWQQVKGLPDAELAARLENLQAYLDVPTVLLDFGVSPLNEVQPKDRFYGLLLLRKALGEAVAGNYRLQFYDFACIWYLHSKRKSLEEIRGLFPLNEVAGLATTTLDAITGNPIGAFVKAALDFGVEDWSERLTLVFAKQGVDKETQQRIRGLDVDRELIDQLPTLFAEDLNASMAEPKAPERMVLLFDTHEAFWGAQRDLPPETYFVRDAWLRRLLRGLELAAGIVVVVAGRDVPRWADAKVVQPRTEIPTEYVQVEEVGLLAAGDARAYLQKVGIEAGALCEGLIRFASVNPQDEPDKREVHPLHLGLCADVVLAATEQGNPLVAGDFAEVPDFDEKGSQLIERLLRYVSKGLRYAIHGLSACRAFDRSIYFHLGKVLNFVADEPTFRQLIRFSFVWQARRQGTGNGEEWYRVHDLMRRLNDAPEVRRAHEALAEYYQKLRSLEQIYHINRLDWSRGIKLWGQAFERCLTSSHYDQCRLLLDIRQELKVKSNFAVVFLANEEGKYLSSLSYYDAALRKFDEAITGYNAAIEDNPQDTEALHNKGNSLMSMANVQQATLLLPDVAAQQYKMAVESFNRVLRDKPTDVNTLNSKGLALTNWAELQYRLSKYAEAKQKYEEAIVPLNQAISLLDQAISHSSDTIISSVHSCIAALNNKSMALIGLAEAQAILLQPEAAEKGYEQAVSSCKRALSYLPTYINAETNMGHALMGWADFHVNQMSYEKARAKYEEAIVAFYRALVLSPNDVHALNSGQVALRKLGGLQYEHFHNGEAALQNWHNAMNLTERSLSIAPNDTAIRQVYDQLTQLLRNPSE